MNERKIILENIDTYDAIENVLKYLDENKTLFLHGNWGSGKTSYLSKVQSKASKKFITIKFWEVKDERSAVHVGFSRIHIIAYALIHICIILSVVISLLMTDIINLGLSKYITSPFDKIIGIVVLIVSVSQFFKIKTDSIYLKLFERLKINNKVLVIDDFDRISNDRQEEIYKLFNLVKGKLPVIFIGDYKNIVNSESSYLQKIIDIRMDLPFVLHPQNIWADYFNKVERDFNIKFPEELKKIIIIENRNLREREHFNSYINQEFFSRGKFNHIHTDQQLWVIYFYLFYPAHYEFLIGHQTIELSNSIKDLDFNSYTLSTMAIEDQLKVRIYILQTSSKKAYPYSFNQKKELYCLYEVPTNLSTERIQSLLSNYNDLKKSLTSNVQSDIYQYVTRHYNQFSSKEKDLLLLVSLKLIKEGTFSDTIDYIIAEKNNELYNQLAKNTNKQINVWLDILNKEEFDFSQKIHLLQNKCWISFNELGKYFSEIDISNVGYPDQIYSACILLTYLSSKNLFYNSEQWDKETWEYLFSISDVQFLNFWKIQKLIQKLKPNPFYSSNDSKTYIVWEKEYNFNPPHEIKDNINTIKKIKNRLKKLEMSGYHFLYKINEDHKPKW